MGEYFIGWKMAYHASSLYISRQTFIYIHNLYFTFLVDNICLILSFTNNGTTVSGLDQQLSLYIKSPVVLQACFILAILSKENSWLYRDGTVLHHQNPAIYI